MTQGRHVTDNYASRALLRIGLTCACVLAAVFVVFSQPVVAATTATGTTFYPSEGQSFSGPVATYSTNGSSVDSIQIVWGDGTSSSGTASGGAIYGTHTYTEEGTYPVHVSFRVFVSPAQPIYGCVSYGFFGGCNGYGIVGYTSPVYDYPSTDSTATVIEVPVDVSGPINITTVEAGQFSGPVATFTDPGGAEATSEYSATIVWGDGQTSAGTVSGGGGPTFTVSAAHTYYVEGIYHPLITVTHGQTSGTAVSTATVIDPSVVGYPGLAIYWQEASTTPPLVVATFADPAGAEAITDYAATINWGDGTAPTVGTISVSNGLFSVTGSHKYAEEGAYTVSTLLHHDTATDVAVSTTATISDVAIIGTGGFNLSLPEGTNTGTVTVATFTDPAGAEALTDYSASIQWGDGIISSGTISNSNGTFTVQGSHTYANEGSLTMVVALTHDAMPPIQVTSRVAVTDPAVTGNGYTISLIEGDTLNQAIAFFTDPGGSEGTDHYSASVNWGDNTPASGGRIVYIGNASFVVTGSHSYPDEGNYTITITVHHDAAPDATIISIAQVADPSVTGTGGFTVNAVEGATSAMQTVATFTDAPGAEALTDYSALISWGDGSTSLGTITYSAPVFTVQGSHKYAEDGSFPINVTLHHDTSPDVTVKSNAVVSDVAITGTGGFTINGVEGASTGSKTVATFTDPGGAEALADYSASIAWGDGTADPGTITFAAGVFSVSGSHTYAEEGTNTISVTLRHELTAPVTVTSTAKISDPSVSGTGGFTVSATEGADSGGQTVATFTDPGGAELLTDYSASIAWGDGSTSPGAITVNNNGVFTVTGAHTYAEEGTPAITVTLHHDASADVTVNSSANVSDPSVVATGSFTVNAAEGAASGMQTVATFTDPAGAEAVGNYQANIAWGDGVSSAGTITLTNGVFTVQGAHTYAEEGAFPITVTLHHETSADVIVKSAAAVTDPAVAVTGVAVSGAEGAATGQVTVATFTDPGGAEVLGDYTASINWGDGSAASGGTITVSSGVFTVKGSHTYAEEGSYTVSTTVSHDSAANASGTSTATIADRAVVATGGFTVTAREFSDTGMQTVATFTDPAGAEASGNYSAGINWGDGSAVSPGTITVSGGTFIVQGAHIYLEEGLYTIVTTIHHESAPDAAATSSATIKPKNGEIIFSRVTASGDSATAYINEMNPDGSLMHSLAASSFADTTPAWSPDGMRIAFASTRGGSVNIFVMNADGTNVTQVTSGPFIDGMPTWSPDGTLIAFASNRGGLSHIYVVNAATKVVSPLTSGLSLDTYPQWSPDGSRITFTSTRDGYTHIYVMNVDGTNVVALTSGTFFDDGASWSPDGTLIVFSSTRGGAPHIYVMNANGTNVLPRTSGFAVDTQPVFSPDGELIAFVSTRGGSLHIYVMNADGTGVIALTSGVGVDTFPSWRAAE